MNGLRLSDGIGSNGLLISRQRARPCPPIDDGEPTAFAETVNQTVNLIPGASQVVATGVAATDPIVSQTLLPQGVKLTFEIVNNQYQATLRNVGLVGAAVDLILGTLVAVLP